MNSKQELITALEQRAKELLQKLEEFRSIENEYRQTSKALAVFKGEPLAIGRPKIHSDESGGLRKGDVTRAALKYLAEHPGGSRPVEVFEAVQMGARSSMDTSLRRLTRLGFVNHGSNGFTINARGLERLAQAQPGAGAAEAETDPELRRSVHRQPASNGHNSISGRLDSSVILRLMAQHPHGLRPKDVAEEMGISSRNDKSRISVMMPYLRSKGKLASSVTKDGVVYKITPKGKTEVANSLAQGA